MCVCVNCIPVYITMHVHTFILYMCACVLRMCVCVCVMVRSEADSRMSGSVTQSRHSRSSSKSPLYALNSKPIYYIYID